MRSIIAIDIGNTSTKISTTATEPLALSNEYILSAAKADLPLCLQDRGNICIYSISNVTGFETRNRILAKLTSQLSLSSCQLKIWTTPEILAMSGINHVADLAHFGTDRALKIYYLTTLPGSGVKISIGCGTAFTIEVLENNTVIESMILPGLGLQLKSLGERTAKLPPIKAEEFRQILKDEDRLSTQYSICYGILSSYLGIIAQLNNRYRPDVILCSGGYASLIYEQAQDKYELTLVESPETVILKQLALTML